MAVANEVQRTRKLAAGLAVVLFLLLSTFMAAFSWTSWSHQRAQQVSTLETILDIGSRTIDSYFVQMERAIFLVSRQLAASGDTINPEKAREVLQEFQDLHPELVNMTVISAEGQILVAAHAMADAHLPSVANQESFVRFLEERRSSKHLHIGQPTIGAVKGQVVVPLRYAAENASGGIRFIVSASLRADYLRNFWKEAPITENSAIGLMRDNGFLISRYPVPAKLDIEAIYGKPRTGALIQYLRDNNYPLAGYIQGQSSLDGPDFLNVFQRLQNYPVTMFIAMPMANVRMAWWEQVYVVYILTLIFVVFGCMAFYYHIKQINKSVVKLDSARMSLLYYSDKLTKLNVELEQFAYVASHDLRQPLRMVTSYLDLISKKLGPQLDDDLGKYLGFAVDGAKRMDRLIIDLLEYSRTGRSLETQPVPLGDAVADAVANLTVVTRGADADIAVADNLPTIRGNPTEITRLFQNLIGNAVKYRSAERPPRVEIGWRGQEPDYLVWVKDNGMGIAPENRDRAFQIFQRLVARDAYEGSGIGLAICKKIVEHCGGKIWIESDVGMGSTFFMTFPMPAKDFAPIT